MDAIPTTQARNQLCAIIASGKRTAITSHGRLVAAIVPYPEAVALQTLQDRGLLYDLLASLRDSP